ncbi:hypothetical protein [Paenibacillus paeoniae]|uniref:hypothetical protein n=1 Tax=Paenibacillus paeoniae TaxID=2292705 RepID=UPI00197E303B|nr:hypothetical protein [Paenibacillus paeoniae]
MKYFWKLNLVSAIFGLLLFLCAELMVNVYRISRVWEWELGTVVSSVDRINIGVAAIVPILGAFIVWKWLDGRVACYWSLLLWIPYFVLFVSLFAQLFPMTYQGDHPAPVTGLIIIAMTIAYPFYLALPVSLGFWLNRRQKQGRPAFPIE